MNEFEEKFSGLQSDMIAVCLEYVEHRADKVYVYASSEGNIISGRFFYLINRTPVTCNRVNDAVNAGEPMYDASSDRQFAVLRVLGENIKKMKALCTDDKRDMPTEMKLIYDVQSGRLTAEYKYEPVYTNDDVKTAGCIADEWFEQVKNNPG